jgi:Protein of unknown function (DUF2961)
LALADPVRFDRRIRVTMEHRHANHLADDWATTAYRYRADSPPSNGVVVPDRCEAANAEHARRVRAAYLEGLR